MNLSKRERLRLAVLVARDAYDDALRFGRRAVAEEHQWLAARLALDGYCVKAGERLARLRNYFTEERATMPDLEGVTVH